MYFLVYETKGWSLEEVDELYSEVSSARKSAAWTPSSTFSQRQGVTTTAVDSTATNGQAEKLAESEGHTGVSHHDEKSVV